MKLKSKWVSICQESEGKTQTEHSEIRFGMVAGKKGFVTPEQVVKALEIQIAEDLSAGKHRRIGEILLEQGLINRSQLDEVLEALKHARQI